MDGVAEPGSPTPPTGHQHQSGHLICYEGRTSSRAIDTSFRSSRGGRLREGKPKEDPHLFLGSNPYSRSPPPVRRDTPACSKVAMSRWQAAAVLTRPMASA